MQSHGARILPSTHIYIYVFAVQNSVVETDDLIKWILDSGITSPKLTPSRLPNATGPGARHYAKYWDPSVQTIGFTDSKIQVGAWWIQMPTSAPQKKKMTKQVASMWQKQGPTASSWMLSTIASWWKIRSDEPGLHFAASQHWDYFPHVPQCSSQTNLKVPSRELTYPLLNALLSQCFSDFPFPWDILVAWRVQVIQVPCCMNKNPHSRH